MQINKRILGWIIVALPALSAYTAPADASVIYLERESEISATGRACVDLCSETGKVQDGTTGFDPYSKSITYDTPDGLAAATAQQSSSLSAHTILMQVSNEAFSYNLGEAVSSLLVRFVLDAPTAFDFIGRASTPWDGGSSQIQLTGEGVDFHAEPYPWPDSESNELRVNLSGFLDPGEYTLWVNSVASGSRPTTYSFADVRLDLIPAPLPAGLPLLLSGVASLIGWSRVRDRRARRLPARASGRGSDCPLAQNARGRRWQGIEPSCGPSP